MSRGWGKLPPVLLATVRHSGSHTALNILEQHFHRHYLSEGFRRDVGITKPPLWFGHSEPENMAVIHQRMTEAKTLVLTMRNPMAIAVSWIHRGMPLDKWFKDMWHNLFKLQAEYNGLWLPVDTPDRDIRLGAISERLGVDIKTDWTHKGVTTHAQEWKSGMTLEEVGQFYKTLNFSQFDYEEITMDSKKKVAKKVAKKPKGRQVGTKLRSFVFTGDKVGGDDPDKIFMYGYMFKLDGKAVKVNADTADKLTGNTHFTEK